MGRSKASTSGTCVLTAGLGCPSKVSDAIAQGAFINLDARHSNSSGNAAIAAVVKNVRTLAKELVRRDVFPNLLDLLLSSQELKRRFKEEAVTVKSVDADGKEFEHRFLKLRVPGAPISIHLACGTGLKVDHGTRHQPVALHAADFIREVQPVVVCAAEVARWSRNPWSLFPWAQAVESLESRYGHPAFLSLDGKRPKPFTASTQQQLFERATQANAEARDMKERTTKAVRGMLPLPDLGGYCRYPFSQAPPPPLAIAWMRDEDAGPRGRQIVFIDTPSVRKTLAGLITYGMPEVFEDDGETPVDQLALVRFYLSCRGLPEWPRERLIDHLTTRGYSTQGARRQHKSAAHNCRGRTMNKSQVQCIIDGIENHLDFYRTGTLVRGIGDMEPAEKAFTLLPPDGNPYATKDDLDRIVRYRAERAEVAHRARRWTFGHQPVMANGCPGLLVVETSPDGSVVYRVRPLPGATGSDAPQGRPRKGRPVPRIPSTAFAQSLVDAVADHGAALQPFVRAPDARHSQAADHLSQLDSTLDRKKKAKDNLRKLLNAESDKPAVTGQLLKDLNDQYNDLCGEIDLLSLDVIQARAVLEREKRKHDPRSIAVHQLLDVIQALGDPENVTFHEEWRQTIHHLAIESSITVEHGTHMAVTDWSGHLLIHEGTDELVIPFSGRASRPTGQQSATEAVIDDLRRGDVTRLRTPYWQDGEGRHRLHNALGIDRGESAPALTIQDPRLLRVAMETIYPPRAPQRRASATDARHQDSQPAGGIVGAPLSARQLPAAARRLNEPLDLIKRVVAVTPAQGHVPGATRKWRTDGDRVVEQVCRAAARRRGQLSSRNFDRRTWEDLRHAAKRAGPELFDFCRGEIRMLPCPHCGSFRRGFLNIREATEPVCWACRRDVTGIDWPRRYDRYRTIASN